MPEEFEIKQWCDEEELAQEPDGHESEDDHNVPRNLTDEQLDTEIKRLVMRLYLSSDERSQLDENNPEAVAKALALARERRDAHERQKEQARSGYVDPAAGASDGDPAPVEETCESPSIPPAFWKVPRCQHIKVNNQQCGSPALKHHRFCYFHGELRGKKPNYLRLPILEDHRAIQMAITKVCQGICDGSIDNKRGSILFYGLQVASAAVPRMVATKSRR